MAGRDRHSLPCGPTMCFCLGSISGAGGLPSLLPGCLGAHIRAHDPAAPDDFPFFVLMSKDYSGVCPDEQTYQPLGQDRITDPIGTVCGRAAHCVFLGSAERKRGQPPFSDSAAKRAPEPLTDVVSKNAHRPLRLRHPPSPCRSHPFGTQPICRRFMRS
jgi:hypothetical protein